MRIDQYYWRIVDCMDRDSYPKKGGVSLLITTRSGIIVIVIVSGLWGVVVIIIVVIVGVGVTP